MMEQQRNTRRRGGSFHMDPDKNDSDNYCAPELLSNADGLELSNISEYNNDRSISKDLMLK